MENKVHFTFINPRQNLGAFISQMYEQHRLVNVIQPA